MSDRAHILARLSPQMVELTNGWIQPSDGGVVGTERFLGCPYFVQSSLVRYRSPSPIHHRSVPKGGHEFAVKIKVSSLSRSSFFVSYDEWRRTLFLGHFSSPAKLISSATAATSFHYYRHRFACKEERCRRRRAIATHLCRLRLLICKSRDV